MLSYKYKFLKSAIYGKQLQIDVVKLILGNKSIDSYVQKFFYSNYIFPPNFPKNNPFRTDSRLVPVAFISSEEFKPVPDSSQSPKATGAAARLKEGVAKVLPLSRKIPALPLNNLSRERNFVVAEHAMKEYLLKPHDLDDLRKAQRRSADDGNPSITVYWRIDVEKRALEVWKSVEALEKEKEKRILLKKRAQTNELKNFFMLNRRSSSHINAPYSQESSRVIWAAVFVNSLNFLGKLCAWLYTGSHSIFSEALHSLADVTNQLILAYGIHKSHQVADSEHPYGFTSMRYVSSLISGAMIFFFGSGISVYHGINGILTAQETLPLFWGYFIMGGTLISESATLIMAMQATRKGAKRHNISFRNYVLQGNDPTVTVVLLEDCAAVISVVVALSCMGMTSVYGSHIPDAMGSCIIGGILACVSGFIIHSNTGALVGRSITKRNLEAINYELESDVMIRGIHDVKGIDIGSGLVRYKAEVDFDGWQLSNRYMDKQDMSKLLREFQAVQTEDDVRVLLGTHGQYIVGYLGAEVDRIEKTLKKNHPEVRHCDLEVL